MPSPRSAARRWLILAGKLLIVGLLIWGVHRTVERALDDLAAQNWSAEQLSPPWLVASGLLYLAGLLPSAIFWWYVLGDLGQRPRLGETIRAYYIGHLGKYVPGKALVVILRTALLRSEHVAPGITSVSVLYETLTMMAVGAAIASLVLAAVFHDQPMLLALGLGMMFVSSLPTAPPIFRRLVAWLGRRGTADDAARAAVRVRNVTLLSGWLAVAGGWCLVGLSLWAALQASMATYNEPLAVQWMICTGTAALAVVAGFLSLIPGGLVVREAIFLALLAPMVGEGAALVAAILARLVWLVAELLISVILYPLSRNRAASEARTPSP